MEEHLAAAVEGEVKTMSLIDSSAKCPNDTVFVS
jgi:hypothetical protein